MPYPETPYGVLVTTLADDLAAHCAAVGETVDWLYYSDTLVGASGQSGAIIFNMPRSSSPANNELEIIVRTTLWRPTPAALITDAGNAFDYIDRHLRGIAEHGLSVVVDGTSYDLFRGWRVQSAYMPADHINIDKGRSLVLEWILIWHTEGVMRSDWDVFG